LLLSFLQAAQATQRVRDADLTILAALVSADESRIWRLVEELEYRILGANDSITTTDQSPPGGLKESGFGREGGRYGVEEYLDVKCMSLGGIWNKV